MPDLQFLTADRMSLVTPFNPLPHGVLATFSLTAWGFMGPPKKDDIRRENAILMRHCGLIGLRRE